MTTNPARYHCISCLNGEHVCSVLIPAHWPGATPASRCVCKRCSTPNRAPDVAPVKPATPVITRTKHPGRTGAPVTVWTADRIQELVELKAQGLTSREIGERVGAKPDIVRHYLQKARRAVAAAAVAFLFGVAWGSVAAATGNQGDDDPSSTPVVAVVGVCPDYQPACDFSVAS